MSGGGERVRRGRSVDGRAEVRRDLVVAAVRLFRTQGYEETTVDDIAAAAGVGRRTFFRYFRSKEDAISPDHDGALARIADLFESAHPDEPGASLVLRAGETVFDLYTDDPQLSLGRFELTHEVPALRDRESASVDHYRRLFTRYLRRRYRDEPRIDPSQADPPQSDRPQSDRPQSDRPQADRPQADELRAAVIGAAVVAAHNVALREWLSAGAPAGGVRACVERFRQVADLLPSEPGRGLESVTERLEAAVGRLERSSSP